MPKLASDVKLCNDMDEASTHRNFHQNLNCQTHHTRVKLSESFVMFTIVQSEWCPASPRTKYLSRFRNFWPTIELSTPPPFPTPFSPQPQVTFPLFPPFFLPYFLPLPRLLPRSRHLASYHRGRHGLLQRHLQRFVLWRLLLHHPDMPLFSLSGYDLE